MKGVQRETSFKKFPFGVLPLPYKPKFTEPHHYFLFIIPHFSTALYPLFVNICKLDVKFITKILKKFTGFAQFVLFHGTYKEYDILDICVMMK